MSYFDFVIVFAQKGGKIAKKSPCSGVLWKNEERSWLPIFVQSEGAGVTI